MSPTIPELTATRPTGTTIKRKRVASIDLLRGIVMIIMALDHTRDYFHRAAFIYSPTDLTHTSVILFFTRFITHYCAPVFVLLAGVSAFLYGANKSKKELSWFLLSRGLWLIVVELVLVSFFRTFNPLFTFVNLQVIWAIGVCMIVLAAAIYMNRWMILLTGLILVAGHNLLDNIHVAGNGIKAFLWAVLHETHFFTTPHFLINVFYPIIPWIGIMLTGYVCGSLYVSTFDATKRKKILLGIGTCAILLFIGLRAGNVYGDAHLWSVQKNTAFSILSFLNVTKYPPSLLYILITLGPAFIFLALAEKLQGSWTNFVTIFGRTPMFYYLAHILLIHILATFAALLSGYPLQSMILHTGVNFEPVLKEGYGFPLIIVYLVWMVVILLLYPLCKWFDKYKRKNVNSKWWLSYV
jgi:uncharacterized membrane protein